jgi:hypothetical protein
MKQGMTLVLALLCAMLAACAGTPAAPAPAKAPVLLPSGLAEGIALYDKGDYNAAIKRLGQSDVVGNSTATRLAAFKYSAFSYCLTNRQTLCRQQFEKALKLDPTFDLAPGEYGHPLWGPVFLKAKKAK